MKPDAQKALNMVLLIGCAYEIVALTTNRIPTITRLLKVIGSKPGGKALLWAWCGYISWHFLEPLND